MIAAAVLIISYFQISFIQIACERQVKKIRLLFYKSVLRQNIGWFDTTASGELASRLNRYFVSFHCTVINASVSILVMLIQFTKVLDRGLPSLFSGSPPLLVDWW